MPAYPVKTNDRKIESKFHEERGGRLHYGLDLSTNGKEGVEIVSMVEGKVIYSGTAAGFGNVVVIKSKSDGNSWLYAHLSQSNVNKGEKINEGQKIGASGNTGISHGPHLHLEKIDAEGTKAIESNTDTTRLGILGSVHRLDPTSVIQSLLAESKPEIKPVKPANDQEKTRLANELKEIENKIKLRKQEDAKILDDFAAKEALVRKVSKDTMDMKIHEIKDNRAIKEKNDILRKEMSSRFTERKSKLSGEIARHEEGRSKLNDLINNYNSAVGDPNADQILLSELSDAIDGAIGSFTTSANNLNQAITNYNADMNYAKLQEAKMDEVERAINNGEADLAKLKSELAADLKTIADLKQQYISNSAEILQALESKKRKIEEQIKQIKSPAPAFHEELRRRRLLWIEEKDQLPETSSAVRTATPFSLPKQLFDITMRPIYNFLEIGSQYYDYLIKSACEYAGQLAKDCPSYFPKNSPDYWKNGGMHSSLWAINNSAFNTTAHIAHTPVLMLGR